MQLLILFLLFQPISTADKRKCQNPDNPAAKRFMAFFTPQNQCPATPPPTDYATILSNDYSKSVCWSKILRIQVFRCVISILNNFSRSQQFQGEEFSTVVEFFP